ncbi:MAG TPA: hypothetical protein VHB46_01075 [Burkholderiales bacterium]|nr:hypothetical protein [Burkholderiales bacterium]
MRNVFLLYMPPGNHEAMVHYRDTIQQRVSLERIASYLSRHQVDKLKSLFGARRIAVWGSRDGPQNRARYERMNEGDDLLIVEGQTIKFLGKIATKVVNPALSRELWKNIGGNTDEGWDLIYFIANSLEIDVPFSALCQLLGYGEAYQLRGFTSVSADKLEAFYDRYDDLYSVLIKIRNGEYFEQKSVLSAREPVPRDLMELTSEDVDTVLRSNGISDHIKMQWKLANLGLKAGEKVWVPLADQGKLRRLYEFNEFEPQFATGIDLPRNYVENIDVVWKEEYRVNAAFEVENTTAIYSGLLRFSDLSILAPNTTYPMFIVAPAARRNQVREQVFRPTFKRLQMPGKVLFLPYETIDEIDKFFESAPSGLSVDLVRGKAEVLN